MQQGRFQTALESLSDGARTTVVLVTRPDHAALREVERTAHELDALGLRNQHLAINAVFHASDASDAVATALEARGARALKDMPERLRALPRLQVPLRAFNMVGMPALRALLDDSAARALSTSVPATVVPPLPGLLPLVDDIVAAGHGLVMVMGKGGVGKTTIAAAVAAELSARGHHVHLSTTDPAAHIAQTIEGSANLTVSRIDPVFETEAYVARVMSTRGASLDDAGRALLAEDLRSPCYEEVAVFAAFSRMVGEARNTFVVLDTAPTGHTLLLLDAAGTYHRQIVHTDDDGKPGAAKLVTPLMRLRDPAHTKVLVVTLAETTPVSEAAKLQADLRRAGIEPWAWVINSSLAVAGSTDPCLGQRIAGELVQIERVRREHAKRLAVVPWLVQEPVGVTRLLELVRGPKTTAR
jgi:arsenite-transporting ATPase